MARKPDPIRIRSRPAAKKAAPATPTRKRSAPRSAVAGDDSPYHHGDLHDALLKAAETVLERDGLAGLTLRAVARQAGVSHAAPTHHFGDLTGLVSELAADSGSSTPRWR
jgi:AcrR family transcriptional regulator